MDNKTNVGSNTGKLNSNSSSGINSQSSTRLGDTLDMDSDSGENISPIHRSSSSHSSSSSSSVKSSSDELSERFRGYYDDASSWVRENQNTLLISAGALAVLGVVGYFVARRFSDSSSEGVTTRRLSVERTDLERSSDLRQSSAV
jgi:hypothetical protein